MNSVLSVAMTTVTSQNGGKFTFNPIYFKNEFGDALKHFLAFKRSIGRF